MESRSPNNAEESGSTFYGNHIDRLANQKPTAAHAVYTFRILKSDTTDGCQNSPQILGTSSPVLAVVGELVVPRRIPLRLLASNSMYASNPYIHTASRYRTCVQTGSDRISTYGFPGQSRITLLSDLLVLREKIEKKALWHRRYSRSPCRRAGTRD